MWLSNIKEILISHRPYVHYAQPPVNAYAEDGRLMTTPDHADTTAITLLHTFGYEGLELLDQGGTWRPVPCRPNGFVMNIGVFSKQFWTYANKEPSIKYVCIFFRMFDWPPPIAVTLFVTKWRYSFSYMLAYAMAQTYTPPPPPWAYVFYWWPL